MRLPRPAPRLAALLLALPALAWSAGPASADAPPAPEGPPPAVAREPAQPSPPGAPRPPPPEPPRWRVAATFGAGTSEGHSYVMFGGLLGYEVGSGFEACLDGQYWGGGSQPSLGRVAPGLNWYAPVPYRPYLGAYYAHWFNGGSQPDQDAVGGRGGIMLASSPRAALGAGLVYERTLGCADQCDAWWPELSVGFRF